MDGTAGNPRVIELPEAARLLGLSEAGVSALAEAGYLRPTAIEDGVKRFALGDVKAFLARVDDAGGSDLFSEDRDSVDPQALLDALDGRSEEMARRAFDIFQHGFPEASQWSLKERHQFIEQARRRFEAILAITEHGEDDELVTELREVGAVAAWSGSSLPQLLVVLRISRDLVVQTAVEVDEERRRHWGLALSLLQTRVLPAKHRLTDAIAQGYWAAVVGTEEETRARHESVVEHSSDGVYELDIDGVIQYANPSLAVILGHRLDELEGARLADVLVPADSTVSIEQLATQGPPHRVELSITRRDGVERVLDILVVARRRGDEVAGFQGIVRDLTAATELEAQKNEFLALITQELRQPLTTILGLGITLEGYAEELGAERVRGTGQSIRRQSERIARLADDLYDVSRIEGRSLLTSSRPVPVESTVRAALFSVDGSDDVTVDVTAGIEVQADPRRLEQVVANLVENALVHGGAPVAVIARNAGDSVDFTITDGGPGVPEEILPTLFSRLRTVRREDRDRSRGTGMGLSLVRGLVEAMGGRVWYEPGAHGGACFRFTLPTPRVHPGTSN
jgi:PAS domain S-box-containing protein